jgi:hypothetical protein
VFGAKLYAVAGRAIGLALEQPLHVVAIACSAAGILKQLEYKVGFAFLNFVEIHNARRSIISVHFA